MKQHLKRAKVMYQILMFVLVSAFHVIDYYFPRVVD